MTDYFSEIVGAKPAPAQTDYFGEITAPKTNAQLSTDTSAQQKTPQDIVSGFVQNAAQKQQGNLLQTGKGLNNLLVSGPVQASLQALEGLGILDKGTTDAYTKKTQADREAFDSQFKKDFGDGLGFKAVGATSEIAPLLALPGGAETALGRALSGAVTGGGLESLRFLDNPQDRAGNTVKGAGFGAAVSSLGEIIPAIKDFVKSKISPAANTVDKTGTSLLAKKFPELFDKRGTDLLSAATTDRQKFIARGEQLAKETGIPFRLVQLDADPIVEGLDEFVRSSAVGERIARSVENVQGVKAYKFFRRTMTKILSGDKSGFGSRAIKAFQGTLGDAKKGTGLLGARKRNADRLFGLAEKSGGEVGLTNTLKAMDGIIAESAQAGAGSSQRALGREIGRIRDELAAGKIKPIEFQNRLAEFGSAAKGTGRVFTDIDTLAERRPANTIYSAMVKDLEEAANSGSKGSQALAKARIQYGKDSALIDGLRETAVGALFKGNVLPAPEKVVTAFNNMPVSQLKASMEILSKADPDLYKSLQRSYIRSFLDKTRVKGPGDVPGVAIAKFLDIKKGSPERFNAVFNDAKSRKMMNTGLEAVQRILVNNRRTSGRTVSKLKELAGVLASRDATFISRLASEMLTPRYLVEYFGNEKGVEALKTIATVSDKNRLTAALLTLNDIAIRRGLNAPEKGQESQQGQPTQETAPSQPPPTQLSTQ